MRGTAGMDLRMRGRLQIGCVFGSQNGMFCRVLHTQALEVIELTVSRPGLRIRRSSVSKMPDFAQPGERNLITN